MPVEAFLEPWSPAHRAIVEQLRRVVRRAAPTAVERVRDGWQLIGYDIPIGRRASFFAWVWPQLEHVHLGFPNGDRMVDPDRALAGAGITKRARWLTFAPGDPIDERVCAELVRDAARVAGVPRSIVLDR
jgi:hypothetical protein